jgi:hypothetical protein
MLQPGAPKKPTSPPGKPVTISDVACPDRDINNSLKPGNADVSMYAAGDIKATSLFNSY